LWIGTCVINNDQIQVEPVPDYIHAVVHHAPDVGRGDGCNWIDFSLVLDDFIADFGTLLDKVHGTSGVA
jgi:hypothetical protein